MLRIAYLILAHHQPRHYHRLVEALSSGSARIFVHLDAKLSSKRFLLANSNVNFVKNPVIVNRGGWSLTVAMLRTLRAAYRESNCDYFIFLAGTDYPIKSNEYIARFLEEHYPLNFINYYPFLDGTSGLANLRRYHFVDHSCRLARMLNLSSSDPDDRDVKFPHLVNRLNEWLPHRSFPENAVPFRGSDRWCLNRDTVQYVLECWASRQGKRYRAYFKYAWGSDEMLFQTIVFNSKWAAQCNLYDDQAVREIVAGVRPPWEDEVKAYLHYIDWDPNREDPAVLDERDFEHLGMSKALFACKFLDNRSATLLDRIDTQLRRC